MTTPKNLLARQGAAPDLLSGLVQAGDIAHQRGEWGAALRNYEAALAIEPRIPLVHYHRGLVLMRLARWDDGIAAMENSLAMEPGRTKARIALADMLVQAGQHQRAIAEFRLVLEDGLPRPDLWGRVAKLEYRCGRAWPAAQAYAMAAESGSDSIHESNRLYASAFSSQVDAAGLAALCRAWGERARERALAATGPRWQAATAGKREARPLRIGYLSPDLREHSVRFFFMPLLRHHDRSRFEVFCYNDTTKRDAAHLALRNESMAHGDRWFDAAGVADDVLAQRIVDDGIDVLVDLAGHTRNNRLALFARRLAPVQVAALGYPPTTGLPTMDYKLSDAAADPPGADAFYSEKLMRLDAGFWSFEPPADAPPVAPSPWGACGAFTFGCYGEPAKISDAVLAAWSEVLRRAPQARLLVKASLPDEPDLHAAVHQRLADAGLPMERVTLAGATVPLDAFLAEYAKVDLILDTWPFNGGTTTCLALWMGVPVLTLAGEMLCSRMGAAMLPRVGLADLVAADVQGYVDAAVQAATDPAPVAALRPALRARMAASSLTDGKAWVAEFEQKVAQAAHRSQQPKLVGQTPAG